MDKLHTGHSVRANQKKSNQQYLNRCIQSRGCFHILVRTVEVDISSPAGKRLTAHGDKHITVASYSTMYNMLFWFAEECCY